MLTMPSFKKSLIVEQFQGNYLKVTMHLQTDHFFEILIFRLMYRSTHELSSKKKKFSKILNDGGENTVFRFYRK